MNTAEPVPVRPPSAAPAPRPEVAPPSEQTPPPLDWLDKGPLPINYVVVGASLFGWLFGKP